MSKQIPMLMESPLTKRVFVVTSYKDKGNGIFEARQKYDVTEQFDALAKQRERIAELEQKVEDLEGMLGELPPEGKCAMLLVQHVGGEYVWACEQYDLASYLVVDLDADTFTGSTLNDMFGRADWGDELAMARELRKMADKLEREGDVLGILGGDE